MLLTIFGLFDLILGGVLAASPFVSYAGLGIVGTLGIIGIIKGLYSTVAAAASSFYFDVLGWLDLIAGILLVLSTMDIKFTWFLWVGIFMAAKGVYSISMEIIGD